VLEEETDTATALEKEAATALVELTSAYRARVTFLEAAIATDISLPLREATYLLEGNKAIAPFVYEILHVTDDRLKTLYDTMDFMHVRKERLLCEQARIKPGAIILSGKMRSLLTSSSCVKPFGKMADICSSGECLRMIVSYSCLPLLMWSVFFPF
jgi:hypothetical protein